MSSERNKNWERLETGEVRVGNESVPIRMTRWHWAALEYLHKTIDMRSDESLAELRRSLTDMPIDQVVRWWIELTFAAVRDRVDERKISDTY